MPSVRALLILCAALLVVAAPARAANVALHDIPTAGSKPTQLIAGPDGRLWFTETGVEHQIGRFDPGSGQFAPLNLPNIDEATSDDGTVRLARSTDGYVWVLDNGGQELYRVGGDGSLAHALPYGGQGLDGLSTYDDALDMPDEIVPAAGGGVWTLFPFHNPDLPGNDYNGATVIGNDGHATLVTSQPYEDPHPGALAPDGSLWIADYAYVTRVGTDGTVQRFPTGLDARYDVSSATIAPDGSLWFSAYQSGSLFTSAHDGVLGHVAGGQVQLIALNGAAVPDSLRIGPDGALWWSELLPTASPGEAQGAIGRLDRATGAVQEGTLGNYKPAGIAFADNGSLWFVDTDANVVGQVAVDGALFPAPAPPAPPAPGPAPIPPPPHAAPLAPAPTLSVVRRHLRTLAAKHALTVRCTLHAAGTCTVRLSLSAKSARALKLGKKALTLSSAHGTLKKSGHVTLKIKLSKKVVSALRHARHSVALTLRTTSSAPGHTARSKTSTVTLPR
ncbi:MAG TPA: hypothetical protein VGM33_18850 [Baekduia sp.]|jgi:virginiamycin B lyase